MSQILFIVKNEGRGHLTQAISLKSLIEQNGHNISGILIGNNKQRQIPDFFINKIGSNPVVFKSPNFIIDSKNKSVKILASILYNLILLPLFLKSINKIHKEVQKRQPDLIVNFNDPLVFLYKILYRPKIPVYMITHSLMYIHPEYKFPNGKKFLRILMKSFTWITSYGVNKKIALSFYPFNDDTNRELYICPPLLRPELFKLKIEKENFILVYLLNRGYKDEIIQWHNNHKNIPMHCFYDETNCMEEYHYDSTLTFHKINDSKFITYMSKCKALITTAGFESVCEAVYLSKPVMMVPVKGQFEQYFNSRDAIKIKAGIFSDTFDIDKFIHYIENHNTVNSDFRDWVNSSSKYFEKLIH